MPLGNPDSSGNFGIHSDAPIEVSLDGTNVVSIDTNPTDAETKNKNRIPVISWLKAFNGASGDLLRAGLAGVQTVFTGLLNVIPMGRYNVTAPSLSDGSMAPFQVGLDGVLKTNPGIYNAAPTSSAGSLTFGASWTKIIAANVARTGWKVQNQTTGTAKLYLFYGPTPPVGGPDTSCELVTTSIEQTGVGGNCTNTDIWLWSDTASTPVHYKEYS